MDRLLFEDTDYKFGCHVAQTADPLSTFERNYDSPLRGWQVGIFSKFQSQKSIPTLIKAKNFLERRNRYCYTHCGFYTNLAESDPSKVEKYRQQTINQMDYCTIMGSRFVQHFGSNPNKEAGTKSMIRSINDLLSTPSKTTQKLSKVSGIDLLNTRQVVLENMAGQGDMIGCSLDEMSRVFQGVKDELKPRVKFCIDTTHIFAYGEYDFGDPESFDQFLSDFDDQIGLDHLECFHFNDSKVEAGSRVDRHQLMGEGYLFDENDESRLSGLRHFLEKCHEEKWPFIYEPPSGGTDRNKEIRDCWLLLNQVCDIETCWC